MSFLEVRHVQKIYTTRFGGTKVQALSDVNFTVEKGEYVAIMGESGSGKTTLLNILAALDKPTGGEVVLDGRALSTIPEREIAAFRRSQLGFVFQEFNLLDTFSVQDNIFLPLVLAGKAYPEMAARLAPIARQLGIAELLQKFPYELSGGQKQRVAIARALATRPKYLLCDEATSALDPNTTQSILRLLKQINQTLGVTIVVITHEMRVIEQICQRVAVIDQSCIAEIGNVSDVFTHPKSDIAKALILPKSPTENLPPCTGKRLRLVFDGSCSNEPVISRITLECNVPVNILFADTRIVEGSIYGHMVIDLPDDPQQFHDVLRWLEHNHISYLQEV